jgi:hypothetical protein
MKRYVCAVAVSMLLALASTGTATAGLPLLGSTQEATQSVGFGDQTIGKQQNDADVNQSQGNGNVNVSPAISVFGDASTSNSQGNDSTAIAKVDQSNEATQSEASSQEQTLDQGGGSCCADPSQSAEQSSSFGDQTIGKQLNDADVRQEQGSGNVNVSPAISVFGDASTRNSQGNGNVAVAKVGQSNEANQSQSASQGQELTHSGGGCCQGKSQSAEQSASFGDQSIGKQKNDADVTQSQGNGNVNVSPALGLGLGKRNEGCWEKSYGTCGSTPLGTGQASTSNAQGNGNVAIARIGQSNSANQSQSALQSQNLGQRCSLCSSTCSPCCEQEARW